MKAPKLRPGFVLAAPLIFTLAACGPSVSSVLFLEPAPSPKSVDQEVRFYSETRPQCPFEEIGSISVRKGGASMERVLEAIRQRVREMGGDAVIGIGRERQVSGAVVTTTGVVVTRRTIISGSVIRFRNPSCSQ